MKIHVIVNSHLDPVWLWNAAQGIDEVISTAESNCEVLDDYPEAIITRGEAWFYEILAENAPQLFERVRNYVKQGRWQVVGGWYIQPDCNFPDAYSIDLQRKVSASMWEKLGVNPTVGYNVDSFGHTASLPDFYASCGVDSYVMMRPMEHEMHLPGNVFRWQGTNGSCITTFRIQGAYCTRSYAGLKKQLEDCISNTDPAIGHNMFFMGMGDHGGGPGRHELDWLREHKNDYPGVEIVISSPRQFFDEIADKLDKLPVYKGELQQHAIGCYTILHSFKRQLRSVEEQLQMGDYLAERYPELAKNIPEYAEFENVKKLLTFNCFHDILAGTCIKSSYELSYADLGRAYSAAYRFCALLTRRLNNAALGRDNRQQLVFDNNSTQDYSGMYTAAPWFGYEEGLEYRKFTLQDKDGNTVPHQIIRCEAAVNQNRVVFPLTLKAGERKVLYINRETAYTASGDLSGELAKAVETVCKQFSFQLMADDSDTWTHGLKRYTGEVKYQWQPEADKFLTAENGPLFSVAKAAWKCPACDVVLSVIKYANDPAIRIGIQVEYHGRQEMLKLSYRPVSAVKEYLAGCPGSSFQREVDGRELPMHNFVKLDDTALVSRDIYAIDSPGEDSDAFRMTLLRSPFYAHHEPFVVQPTDDYPLTEQGEHFFNCTIIPEADMAKIEAEVVRQSNVVMFSESTRGCNREYLGDPNRGPAQ